MTLGNSSKTRNSPRQTDNKAQSQSQAQWSLRLLFGLSLALFLLSPPLLILLDFLGKTYSLVILPFFLFGLWSMIILLIFLFSFKGKRLE